MNVKELNYIYELLKWNEEEKKWLLNTCVEKRRATYDSETDSYSPEMDARYMQLREEYVEAYTALESFESYTWR